VEIFEVPKCPRCESSIREIKVTDVPLKGPGDEVRYGLVYECPSCQTLLSLQIDSVQLTDEIIKAVREGAVHEFIQGKRARRSGGSF
jgi:hypothetical protein